MSMVDAERLFATPLQAGMIYHALAHPGTGVDVEHVAIDLRHPFDLDRFRAAWAEVVESHPILRTSFKWVGEDRPLQIVAPSVDLPFETLDWTNLAENEIEPLKRAHATSDRVSGFDLARPPLLRFSVASLPGDQTWILWSFHHALLDGRSFPILLDAVFARYDEQPAAETLAPPFSEFSLGLDALDQTETLHTWSEKLADIESPTSIAFAPLGTEAGVGQASVAAVEVCLSGVLTKSIRSAAESAGVSVNNIVQSAWALLLHHYSQQPSVVFGTTRAGRHVVANSDDMVGLLINTVPFVVSFTPELTVRELLGSVRDEHASLRSIESAALNDIQAASSLGSTPLFDNIVMFDEATLDTRMIARLGDRATGRRFSYTGQTNFTMTLLAYAEPEMLVRIEYDVSRYSDADARRVLGQLANLLSAIPSGLDQPAVSLSYLHEDEHRQLDEWNASDNDWNLDRTLMELFEAQVARTPDAPAVKYRDEELTYAEFNERINRMAHHLRGRGVVPEMLVGISVERSIDMEVGIHAIMKAGAGFVPLDPDLPADRLAFMADDAGATMVLTQRHLVDRLALDHCEVIVIDDQTPPWADQPTTNPEIITTPDQLAYALFTSGSTGRPKCAMNEHRGIVNRILWMQDVFPLDASDTVLQKTPYSFDVSVWEHNWPFHVGARLVIAEPGGHQDPIYLADTINAESVTTIHFVPSMLQLFVEEPKVASCTSLRRIIASGEALPRELQDRVFAVLDSELHNLYGPTEAAIDVTWWACDATSPLPHIPIGRTIANTQIHILDPQLRRLPPGVAGELHIGGVQVGRGYLNREELTADRFVADPFREGGRLYKTGDLARFMPDGNVEYLGRLDHQIKIRGLRIELGEIEAILSQHSSVREVVVVATEGRSAQQILVAYLVGTAIDVNELRQHSAQFLAEYMVPSEWMVLDAFPLNNSGKVDRSALPTPEITARNELLAPRSSSESTVAGIWREILGHEELSVTDTFFDVGGSSLSVIRLASHLSEVAGREVRVAEVLRHTTIAQQAEHILDTEQSAVDERVEVGASRARQQREARARRRRR